MRLNMVRFLLFLVLVPVYALAVELSPKQSHNAQQLYESVRCPTCVAQSVKDSDTIASSQIREFIDRRIELGESDDAILNALRQYYGPEITFKPPVKLHTLLLWCLPLVYLIFAIYRLFKFKTKNLIINASLRRDDLN